MSSTTKRQKHDYTSELELKCLLIRIKNRKLKRNYSLKNNQKINKYIKLFLKLNNTSYTSIDKKAQRIRIKEALKSKAIELSETTNIDNDSYNQFGKVILLMIQNILKKPNFSNYTYVDDFYSDAIHKILSYLHNFDHTKISLSTKAPVSAFAYISTIIHHSILFIIKSKNKNLGEIKNHIKATAKSNADIRDYEINNISNYEETEPESQEFDIISTDSLIQSLYELQDRFTEKIIHIHYPKNYKISFEEYEEIKIFSNQCTSNINLHRHKKKA